MHNLVDKLKQGWLRLTQVLNSRNQVEHRLLEALQRDYVEEKRISALLEQTSERIPYDHLRRRLREIASAENQHAELLAASIRQLGGELPDQALTLSDRTNWLDLPALLLEERDEYLEYLDAAHLAQDAGYHELSQRLQRMGEEERKHRKELVDILMRLNPLPLAS